MVAKEPKLLVLNCVCKETAMGRKKVLTKSDKLLSNLYFDPAAPGSFSGIATLKRAAEKRLKEKGNKRVKIKLSGVKKFLSGQETFTLHKPVTRKFDRRRVIVSGPLEQFQSDLVDMSMFESQNDGYKWILMTIDVFTKRAYAIAVKRKDARNIVEAFEKLFRQTETPRKLQTDKGMEFRAAAVQAMFKDKGITWFASEDDYIKAGVVERLNRTIKGKMWKYFHYKKSNRWLEVLPQLMQSYNNTVHSSIKMTPTEATNTKRVVEVRDNLFGPKSRLRMEGSSTFPRDNAFGVGDNVKLSKHALVFDKGYKPNWTLEIMKVSDVIPTDPVVYRVKDLDGEEIKGTFYEHELQKVSSLPEVYDIEKVIEEKGDRLFVKWKGYPAKFNRWIPKSTLR